MSTTKQTKIQNDDARSMTPGEISAEREYRMAERLGIMCGDSTPTPEQLAIAHQEADEWERTITNEL
jgi:hypothetical protein